MRPRPAVQRARHEPPFGAFVGSWDNYIPNIAKMATWLNGADMQVGHTYLAGNGWGDVEGESVVLGLWSQWKLADPQRKLVLGVPMLVPNENNMPDAEVARLLARANKGEFDLHFLKLARKLVALGGQDTVMTLGWEMNGTTYTSRCKPDPTAWKAYWRRIVTVMRSVPGQHFKFDFNPTRGWTPSRGRAATRATTWSTSSAWTATTSRRRHLRRVHLRAVRAAGPGGVRRQARQAGLVPGVGAVPQRRQPGVRPADGGVDAHPRHRLPDRHRLLPARLLAVRPEPEVDLSVQAADVRLQGSRLPVSSASGPVAPSSRRAAWCAAGAPGPA
ncbi:hypothetical protein ACFQ0T_10730 [Kitasatospora gansuensis]